jgi:hypothetical protein
VPGATEAQHSTAGRHSDTERAHPLDGRAEAFDQPLAEARIFHPVSPRRHLHDGGR